MSWRGLRRKGFEILFPDEWNTVIDSLDELYGLLTTGEGDINVRLIYGEGGFFETRIYAEGRPVLLDWDPIQVYQFYDIAREQLTEAIDRARVTGTADLIREYTERSTRALEAELPKLELLKEYARETRDVAVKLRINEYGNIGVVIAEPLDAYGRVAVGAPQELVEEFKPVHASGSITAAENVAGFSVTLAKGGRPNVNVYYMLGGAGEVYVEVSIDGVTWRTLHHFTFTGAVSDMIVDTGISYPLIRVRTPTAGVDVVFEVVASR